MSEKKNSTALVPTKKINSLPVPVKKGELKTPFSLVDKAIYLNNKKGEQQQKQEKMRKAGGTNKSTRTHQEKAGKEELSISC